MLRVTSTATPPPLSPPSQSPPSTTAGEKSRVSPSNLAGAAISRIAMADPRVKVGLLVPIESDVSVQGIAIFEGDNVVGRENLSLVDKRVSRKHIRLHASVDGSVHLVVEGSNPVIVKSGDERKKLCSRDKAVLTYDDIIELIPGHHLLKYVRSVGDPTLAPETIRGMSSKERRHSEEDAVGVKRSRQILEDEAFARSLQKAWGINSYGHDNSVETTAHVSRPESAAVLGSLEAREASNHFSVPKDRLSYIFRLMRVQGIPELANSSSVAIHDVIEGNPLVAILSNYMVDIDWLMTACPDLRKIPHVLVVHGESGGTVDHLKKSVSGNWILHKPPLPISYGTHHSKAMLLVYPRGLRVVVHTANLIYVDWNNKTQGLWMQDFPWKDQKESKGCLFENDLVDYLNALKWPEFKANLPMMGNVNINAAFFRKFDYNSAAVRLIASVPGYHVGPNLKKWGHMKLRTVLEECIFDKEFCKSPLIYQFSSLGSLDDKWLAELALSMSSGITNDKSPLGIGKPLIIWPTVEDVRCSLEGYAAGNAVPSPQKNVEREFLKKYWARWKANHVSRCRAMPHIKTYARYNGQNLAWFLLTSANLSKAAWGALQKNNSQLMIRSYELGVLFLPSYTRDQSSEFSCTGNGNLKQGEYTFSRTEGRKTKLVTLCWKGTSDPSTEVIRLPVPYQLPPQPYTSQDVPWSWDKRYTKKDVYGQVWPRHVQLYTDQN